MEHFAPNALSRARISYGGLFYFLFVLCPSLLACWPFSALTDTRPDCELGRAKQYGYFRSLTNLTRHASNATINFFYFSS
jgi:hypothetical protein